MPKVKIDETAEIAETTKFFGIASNIQIAVISVFAEILKEPSLPKHSRLPFSPKMPRLPKLPKLPNSPKSSKSPGKSRLPKIPRKS